MSVETSSFNNTTRDIKRIAGLLFLFGLAMYAIRCSVGPLPLYIHATAVLLLMAYAMVAVITPHGISPITAGYVVFGGFMLCYLPIGFFSGGINAPILVSIPLAPAVAILTIRPEKPYVLLFCTGIPIVLFLFIEWMGHTPALLPEVAQVSSLLRGLWLLLTAIVVTMVCWEFSRSRRQSEDKLFEMATIDHLTGLTNRRGMENVFMQETAWARRHNAWLSILLIDIDHFKRLNDRRGHNAGDQALRELAVVMTLNTHRPHDLIGRWGGEEFIIILPEAGPEGAIGVAERLRIAIEKAAIEHTPNSSTPYLTATIGVSSACFDKFFHYDRLVEAADKALYRGKEKGRNCVEVEVLEQSQPDIDRQAIEAERKKQQP